jgi:hypothetical protein
LPAEDDINCPIWATAGVLQRKTERRLDMTGLQAGATTLERHVRDADWDDAFADVVADLDRRGAAGAEVAGQRLRCVSSGYLANGCSCSASIPAEVVAAVWERELARGGDRGDRFFRIAWQEDVWLAFGLQDGGVRGVYCPSHSAERDERAFAAAAAVAPSRCHVAGA